MMIALPSLGPWEATLLLMRLTVSNIHGKFLGGSRGNLKPTIIHSVETDPEIWTLMKETFLGKDPTLDVKGALPNATVNSNTLTEADLDRLSSTPPDFKFSPDQFLGPIFDAMEKVDYMREGMKAQGSALAAFVKEKLGVVACYPRHGDELAVAVTNSTCPLIILTYVHTWLY